MQFRPSPCVYIHKMSSPPPPRRPAATPLDEDAEARELYDYFRQQDPVDVAAASWHTRWEQGLSADEVAKLQEWLADSPVHAEAFQRMGEGVAALRTRSRASRAPRREAGRWLQAWRSVRWPLPRMAMAASCCAVVLAVGAGWRHWQQQPTFSSSYAAERGQRLNLTLPDGTEMAMDADTQAKVTLYRDRREVRLAEGQVMLSVAPDTEKPFHVLAGPAKVSVLGTRFSVRYRTSGADAGAANVAVEEGRVAVSGVSVARDGSASAMAAMATLTAGQGVAVSPAGVIGEVTAVPPGSVALWRQGMVRFDNITLADALSELERYGPTRLAIRDPAVAGMRIGGSYRVDRPGDFARMLPKILPVQLSAASDGTIEIARAR